MSALIIFLYMLFGGMFGEKATSSSIIDDFRTEASQQNETSQNTVSYEVTGI